jgi:hypothetical protein
MKYNLTALQQDAARCIVEFIRKKLIGETFEIIYEEIGKVKVKGIAAPKLLVEWNRRVSVPQIEALSIVQMMRIQPDMVEAGGGREIEYGKTCTVTGLIYEGVDSDFSDGEETSVISTLAQPHPPEIAISLDRFRGKFPNPNRVGFLIMRFAAAKPYANIVEAIRTVGVKHGLSIVRADENEFHADLWGNVRTHLHGCGFGIAVYERIDTEEPNANVGLEVGYLLAMNKPVLLLKDKTVGVLQADLAGRLYKPFDPHDAAGTIPAQLEKWLVDYAIIVPPH